MISLKDLADKVGCEVVGDPTCKLSGVNDLKSAGREDVSFLANPRYKDLLTTSQAGVICIDPKTAPLPGKNYLISSNPSQTFQQIAEHFLGHGSTMGFQGIHPSAVIHPNAILGKDVQIGPYVVIDEGAKIGARTQIYPHCYIGRESSIGEDCTLYPGVMVRESCEIKNRVILQSGAIIGSCGFGYLFDPEKNQFIKLEQLGKVILEDDVEVGANTTIDRARFKATIISKGTKIDKLVQIGHNALIGENNIIISQTGIAGSVETGENVMFGGQCGVVGHVKIAPGVQIATRGGVSKSIQEPNGKYRGSPLQPIEQYNKQKVHLRKIDQYVQRIRELEKRLEKLEIQLS